MKESKNQSGIELPSQNDSKIGLLGKASNLIQNMNNTNIPNNKKKSPSELPNNYRINDKNRNSKKFSVNNSSEKDEMDSFSAKSSSRSSKGTDKVSSKRIEKLKEFAEDYKYKNLKDNERIKRNYSIENQKNYKEEDNIIDKDMEEEDEFNYDDNINIDLKDHRRLTKREKIVILL